eukprot:5141512-Ditylum_brightwellii.AAC.1
MSRGINIMVCATVDATADDEGKHITQSLMRGTSITVSNGSYKDSRGTTTFIVDGKEYKIYHTTAAATIHGKLFIHNVYRAELTDIYMVTQIVTYLCQIYSITEGAITIACNGGEAIYKAMGSDTSYSPYFS